MPNTINIPGYGPTQLPDGINVQWSPVNQAWIVAWNTSVLRTITDPHELHDYVAKQLVRGYSASTLGADGGEFPVTFAPKTQQAPWYVQTIQGVNVWWDPVQRRYAGTTESTPPDRSSYVHRSVSEALGPRRAALAALPTQQMANDPTSCPSCGTSDRPRRVDADHYICPRCTHEGPWSDWLGVPFARSH